MQLSASAKSKFLWALPHNIYGCSELEGFNLTYITDNDENVLLLIRPLYAYLKQAILILQLNWWR